MHHYEIAREGVDKIIEQAVENGWSETEALQSILVHVIERYGKHAGVDDTRQMLEYELSNLRGTVDYDFVRSR